MSFDYIKCYFCIYIFGCRLHGLLKHHSDAIIQCMVSLTHHSNCQSCIYLVIRFRLKNCHKGLRGPLMKASNGYIGHKNDQLCEIILVLGRGGVRVSPLYSLIGCLFPVGSYMLKCTDLFQMITVEFRSRTCWRLIFLEDVDIFQPVLELFFLNNSYIPESGNIG